MITDNTDNMEFGDCTFKISTSNQLRLEALSKYAMMLDLRTNAQEGEFLNIDGLINCIFDEGMDKRIRDLVKKHGFLDNTDFVETLLGCEDGDDVSEKIKSREEASLQRMHDKILSYIPLEDKQSDLPFGKQDKKEKSGLKVLK